MGSRSKARARAKVNQPAARKAQAAQKPQQAAQQRQQAAQQGQPSAAAPKPAAAPTPTATPRTVLAAATVQLIEAVAVLGVSIFVAVETATGRSYQQSSGIALTLIGIGTTLALAFVARGIRAGRRWSRTPAMLTQLFTGIVAIYLMQSGRFDWGVPAVLLAIAGFGTLLAPSSVEMLTPGRAGKASNRG